MRGPTMTAGSSPASGYRVPITRPWLPPLEDYTSLLERVWSSHMLSNFGPLAVELEEQSRSYLGAGSLLSASSGDIALVLAIKALGLPAASRVLVPSFTFNSTVNAIIWNGHTPVFVDIDLDTLNVDPTAVRRHADGAGAIVATHVFGNPAPIDALTTIAAGAGIPLIFDAAHGYGSLHRGRNVGTFGSAEVFSLSATKPVTSAEGGMIATNDPELAERFRYLRAYGFQTDYVSHFVGLNGKLSELHAALGLLTMSRVEDALVTRSEHVNAYRRRLGELPGIAFQSVSVQDRSTFKDFAILFDDGAMRDRVEAELTRQRIQTKRYFHPCHLMPAYRAFVDGRLPVTESTYSRILCIPLFEDMTVAERDLVCSAIESAVASAASRRPRSHIPREIRLRPDHAA
jgi:dTDP-4-amino-4,6-dideoxygalactose transaminase